MNRQFDEIIEASRGKIGKVSVTQLTAKNAHWKVNMPAVYPVLKASCIIYQRW